MPLEEEFKQYWAAFHENINKALTLLSLYPPPQHRAALRSYEKAVPVLNSCFIELLGITDERLLRIFREWKDPVKTADLAQEIENKQIGGHLQADVTYTFWKYADVVPRLHQ